MIMEKRNTMSGILKPFLMGKMEKEASGDDNRCNRHREERG